MRTDPLENPVAFDPDIQELADKEFVLDLADMAQDYREHADRLHQAMLDAGVEESLVWKIRLGLPSVVA